MLLLKSDESLLLAAEARRKIWASQHPLSRVAICVSTTRELAAHRADVDIFARPEVHVIHQLVEHHCTVGVDHSFQRLQLGLREHRTAVGVCITGVDVSIVQEAMHPLHDCRRGRPLRETATPRRAVAHELAAVAEQKGNLIVAETVIEVQGDGERAGVLIVHAPRRAPSADLRDGRAQGTRRSEYATRTRKTRRRAFLRHDRLDARPKTRSRHAPRREILRAWRRRLACELPSELGPELGLECCGLGEIGFSRVPIRFLLQPTVYIGCIIIQLVATGIEWPI